MSEGPDDAALAAVEARLRAFALRGPPEGLRERVLAGARRSRRRAAWRAPLALAAAIALAALAGWIDDGRHAERLSRIVRSGPSRGESPPRPALEGLATAAGLHLDPAGTAWLARRAEAARARLAAPPAERWARIKKEGGSWKR